MHLQKMLNSLKDILIMKNGKLGVTQIFGKGDCHRSKLRFKGAEQCLPTTSSKKYNWGCYNKNKNIKMTHQINASSKPVFSSKAVVSPTALRDCLGLPTTQLF